ncbi:hypothetical protein SAMN05428975_4335 [Mucilaginibacter sp. OK268]|nr:hypothetical protein SAMN05428975_4335 [Mucilaginibacter sp. OK268]
MNYLSFSSVGLDVLESHSTFFYIVVVYFYRQSVLKVIILFIY